MSSGHLISEAFWTSLTGKRPWGRPRTHWRNYGLDLLRVSTSTKPSSCIDKKSKRCIVNFVTERHRGVFLWPKLLNLGISFLLHNLNNDTNMICKNLSQSLLLIVLKLN